MDIEEARNVWEYRIQKLFTNTEKKSNPSDILWEIVNLILYENARDTTLIEVFNTLDRKSFTKLIQLLDGRNFKSPTKKNLEEALLTAVFYYEKEFNGKDWKTIQDEIDFEISPRKYGIRVRNLNNYIVQKIQEMLTKGEDDERE